MVRGADSATILFMGTYPPRECGIATFTKDLSTSIEKRFTPSLKSRILAINKNGINIYNYPHEVIYQLSDTEQEDYIKIAEKINENKSIKLVSIQHEFGIFGGKYGSYLLDFLEHIKKPVIITFHSVLPNPKPELKEVVRKIAEKVKTIVIMNKLGINILRKDYDVKTDIKVIPHGIPSVSFQEPIVAKQKLDYDNKIILSSFGMLSSGKGYEYAIEALPKVVEKFPNLLYLIVGETHPVVRKKEGETYRNYLEKRIKELGLQKNVRFYNKYLTLKEILKFLTASDIYISPSKDPNQITSGTLAYAMGCGRAIVSTPMLHALDAVNDERGLLVKFDDSNSFSEAIIKILSDNKLKENMEKNNYAFTRKMTWKNIAMAYKKLFENHIQIPEIHEKILPKINTFHLKRLTDNFGIIQFANYVKPDIESGYTLDDNARALTASVMLYNKTRNEDYLRFIKIYLDYISYVQKDDGKIYNYVDKNKNIDFDNFSEEAYGRVMKALGFVIMQQSLPKNLIKKAEDIFLKSLNISNDIKYPRAVASVLIGMYFYNKARYSEKNMILIRKLADYLCSLFDKYSRDGWHWFEPYLTYSNSKLSEALFYSYISTQNRKYLETASLTLNFLITKTFDKDLFVPISNKWHYHDGERSYYDQQPVEAGSMISTLLLAHRVLNNNIYKRHALKTFQWFLGANMMSQALYDDISGGCHDGLGEKCVNMNQGAESTLSYLLARLSLGEF